MIELEEIQRRVDLYNQGYWEVPDGLDTSNFDFDWRPNPYDRPYIHQFGTQWQKTGGPRFIVPNNEGIKYQSCQKAIRLPNPNDRCWRPLKPNCTIDYSWHPDEFDKPYIYVFGNQWYDIDPTYQYRVKGATEKKFVTELKATVLPDMSKWELTYEYDKFDYSWVPHPYEPPMIYEFGTQHQKNGGPKYICDNPIGIKEISEQVAYRINGENDRCWRPLVSNIEFDYNWHPDKNDPPYIYVFGNQWYGPEKMPTVLYRVKGATEKKYVHNIKAKLLPNKDNWIIPEDISDDFDYSWVPDPNEPPYIWQFGTQHQKTGGPKYIVKDATTVKYTDIMKAIRLPNIRKFRVLENIDIDSFDFSWHPDETEDPYTYVFGNQYFDSANMPTITYHVKGATVQKHMDIHAKLTSVPTVEYTDSIFDSVLQEPFNNKYIHFKPKHSKTKLDLDKIFTDSTDKLHILNGTEVVVFRDIKTQLYDKLTDYKNIKYHLEGSEPQLLDIVFLSNGETCAEENYEHLLSLNLPNRIVRLSGIKGRVQSQYAAAESSSTPWYFLVNAKLKVNKDFDFSWQPNILKSRRHYIFRATNPVNGLEYGHMAMVANNKILTLKTKGISLDFTMESLHEVVDINCGIAMYNSSVWDAWRTSFRECIKLCNSTDTESKTRLETWKTGSGMFAEHSIKGAMDAIEYYKSVNGEFDKLMLSYDWAWLEQYYSQLYPR